MNLFLYHETLSQLRSFQIIVKLSCNHKSFFVITEVFFRNQEAFYRSYGIFSLSFLLTGVF